MGSLQSSKEKFVVEKYVSEEAREYVFFILSTFGYENFM